MSAPATGEHIRQRLARSIRQRRTQLNMSQGELATKAGLKVAQVVSAIELGQREVKIAELAAIASALHCHFTDLIGDLKPLPEIAWRNPPAAGIEEEQAQFEELCQGYEMIERWTDELAEPCLPPIARPKGSLDFEWAALVAEDVRERLGLGTFPAKTLMSALEEECGIKVFLFANLRGSAACFRWETGAGIALNASESRWRQQYSLGHELFHLITWDFLGPQANTTDGSITTWPNRVEQLAEAFSAALLMPEHRLSEQIHARRDGREISKRDLIEIAEIFDVSTQALVWRLFNLKLITRAQVEALLTDASFRRVGDQRAMEGQTSQPQPDTQIILPERFLRLLKTAYLQGDVSAGRAANLMGQTLSQARRLLAEWEEDQESVRQTVRLA